MTPREVFQWESGYSDGYQDRPVPPEPAWHYQLGYHSGLSDRLTGKARYPEMLKPAPPKKD